MYVAKENFKAKGKTVKVGEPFDGSFKDADGKPVKLFDEKECKELEAAGLIVPNAKVDAATLAELQKKVDAKKAELADLEAKCAELAKKASQGSGPKDKS